jgi:hypothetical protein
MAAAALLAMPAYAGQDAQLPYDGPPPPSPPAVIVRDEAGRATIRASRVSESLRIDGRLDEAVFESVPAMSDFVQQEPQEGAPSTERTEIWLLYDDDYVYVAARNWESRPERIVANEMRRDNNMISMTDAIAFTFDTFYDRRNSVIFHVTPIGGRMDGQGTNERQWSSDWNPIWDYAVGRFEGGWTMEAAIPFKSLRYRPGREQLWGFNARRYNRWKNELSYLVPIPRARGLPDIMQVSRSATVVGLEAPPGSKNVEIKPYATSHVTSDSTVVPRVSNDVGADLGVDVKYGVTQNLTADFTYNTDFAQVEADEQQINLTRFSLFFPEKREFFLENQGLFNFGGVAGTNAGDTPILFYSRRIGLAAGREVPIVAGARLNGRVGRTSVGLLSIQADDEPLARVRATNFSAVRLRRDILRRSNIGLIATARSRREAGPGRNDVYGVDGAFAFFDSLTLNAYAARAKTDGVHERDTSHRVQLDYPGDRYGLTLERLVVGRNFAPDIGFVRRRDMEKSYAAGRFSPRPASSRIVRRLGVSGVLSHITNGDGRLETRERAGEFAVEFQNGDRAAVGAFNLFEFLPVPFGIAPGVTIPSGGYAFNNLQLVFSGGQQRALSGTVQFEHGSFYDGERTALTVSRGRLGLHPQCSLAPTYSVNRVRLGAGNFTTTLLGSRITYTVTPLMFVSALLQYNSSSDGVSANVRLRWEYRPGSELFVVYNEQRDTLARAFPDLAARAVIVKINRLFRF